MSRDTRSGERIERWVTASYWAPPVVLCAAMFLVSSQQAPEIITALQFSDKVEHFLAYAILGFLFGRAAGRAPGWSGWRTGVWVAGLAAGYGVFDEFHQWFTPGRSAQVTDAIADTLGGTAGTILYWYHMFRRVSRR